MTAASNSRSAPVQPSAGTAGGSSTTPGNLLQRLRAAHSAFMGGCNESVATDPHGIVAWAHGEIAGANFSRMADDDDGWRVAMQCRVLGNPMIRPTPASRDELVRRISKAWPELDPSEVQRLMSHMDARTQAVLLSPSRGQDQAELSKARGSWVHGWRLDARDTEAATR